MIFLYKRRKYYGKRALPRLISIAVFAVFVFVVFGMVFLGFGIYSGVQKELKDTLEVQTSLRYITTKVAAARDRDSVFLTEYMGIPALAIEERGEDGETYVSYIYNYDGALKELFIKKDSGIKPEAGTPVCTGVTLGASEPEEGLFVFTATGESGSSGRVILTKE